ncbi:rubrerythrin family protein [uncultured Rikenella sp.]|uniref:rubrerythrin family protein n=1 Tax=uncultured Rikenella sp. TaxID=368003 RepID=UPI0026183224|nr:rubrerythrin family protein [uncultured Rikenella sp.]
MHFFLSHWAWLVMALPLFCACSSHPAKTIENLKNMVASEQNAAVRYRAFSIQAREEGFHNIANLLVAIARSEEIHAEYQRKVLAEYGEDVSMPVDSVPEVGSTLENLKNSLRVEEYESQTVFPIFMQVAANERMSEAEQFFQWVAAVANRHAEYCRKALGKLEKEGDDRNVVNSWSVCPRCGCPYTTVSLDEACDVCQMEASAFFLFQQ